MGATPRTEDSLTASLRDHVRRPVSTAVEIVEAEYEEVESERRAFERFEDRVIGIETVSLSGVAPPGQQPKLVQSRSRRIERVRSAFRETVMSVPHYDDVYGETLDEHFAAELSAELAAGLGERSGLQFTDLYKRTLLSAVARAIERHETFCDILESERTSLEASRERLDGAMAELEGTRVPAGARTEFTDTLDELAKRRQTEIAGQVSSPRTDGHELCIYLYGDQLWTYPVLTGVTRLREGVNGLAP
jgi:hypothetical protein